jgi:hypothetical protein
MSLGLHKKVLKHSAALAAARFAQEAISAFGFTDK